MKKTREELFWEAKRFDEGHLYQTEECTEVVLRMFRLRTQMSDLFGPAFETLMEAYCEAASFEMELERRHYFDEGCRIGRAYKDE